MISVSDLSREHIDMLSEQVFEILTTQIKLDRKEALRLRLSVEEVLLMWRDTMGEEQELELRYGKRLGRPFIELSLEGERFNPYKKLKEKELGDGEGTQNMLAFYGLAPSYAYVNGVNRLTLMPRRKPLSTIQKMLFSFVLAILVGLLCGFLPEAARSGLAEQILQPLFETFMELLSAISGPMIFLSVLWGIYAIGDISMLGRIGKVMMGRFVALTFVALSLCAAATFWVFDLNFESLQGTQSQFGAIYSMILDIIPPNIVAPFYDGNSLQLIFLAIGAGLAMLILKDKTTVMAQCVEQLNYIVQLAMETVGALVPVFIFTSVLNMMLTGVLLSALSSAKVVIVCVFVSVLIVLFYMLSVSIFMRVPLKVLLKKMTPTMLIALTTASSSAAFGTNMETCEEKLGIDKRIINFGVPMGQVVFMPGAGALFLLLALAMAQYYQVSVSLSWIIMAIFVAGLLAIAAPPIPGGTLSCYTILFLQLGIPSEAVAIAIALNTVLEFVATASNLGALQMELTLLAKKMDMIDTDVLRK